MIYSAQPVVKIWKSRDEGIVSYTSYQIPTFYLDSHVQGIVDEAHAAKIVERICNPAENSNIVVAANVVALHENSRIEDPPNKL